MSSATIWSRVRERPFRPFRLNTSDGKSYDVVHPEMILITRHRVTIPIYDAPVNDPLAEIPSREVVISPLRIASPEDMPSPQARAR